MIVRNSGLDIIKGINQILMSVSELPKIFAKNYIWIANNYTNDESTLSMEER